VNAPMKNAEVMKMLPLRTSNRQEFDATFATNVRGTFDVLEQAARRLSDGSRIVTLSTSVTALFAAGIWPYARNRSIASHTCHRWNVSGRPGTSRMSCRSSVRTVAGSMDRCCAPMAGTPE